MTYTGLNRLANQITGTVTSSGLPSPELVVMHMWPYPQLEEAYRNITNAGRHEQFIRALAVHPENHDPENNRKWLRLAAALSRDRYANVPFAALCTTFHISPTEVIPYFADYQRVMSIFEASDRAPQMVRELAEDGMHRTKACRTCASRGYVYEDVLDDQGYPIEMENGRHQRRRVRCLECDGTGQVEVPGDSDARERTLEIAGILNTAPAPAVAIQQNFAANLESTVTDVGKILKGRNG